MDIFILQSGAVKQLGEQIGYGNMMYIASELWKIELKRSGFPTSGAFVPVLQSDIKSTCKVFYEKQFKEYETLLTPPPPDEKP